MISIDVISLGCSKNLVDSEHLMRQFELAGFRINHNPSAITGDIAIVNTCGFIADAQQESIDMILKLGQAKRRGEIKKLFVMGCLAERFMADLVQELPEVDKFYGKFSWKDIIKDLGHTYNSECQYQRKLTTPPHYAYLKISEGCNRHCAFCAIPLITGTHKSIPVDTLLRETQYLVDKGVKEFNVIAQDLSSYGWDLEHRLMLPELIDNMAQIPGVRWIRLHYAYPSQFPEHILDVMAKHDNVCNYLDIALQHASDRMLSRMHRHITSDETVKLIQRMRQEVPGIHLRTTLMTGFPGETDDDFKQLLDFTKEMRFERMGAFAYSHEAGTFAYKNYTDDVPQDVKEHRLEQLMDIQEKISLEIQEQKIAKTFNVIIDSEEEEYFVGRTEWDSPEVDPEVLIKKSRDGEKQLLKIGDFYPVTIDEALPFELIGHVAQ